MTKIEAELFQRDVDFSKQAQTEGLQAWEDALSNAAIMITDGHNENIIGKTEIIRRLQGLYHLEELEFMWEPLHVECSIDQEMGFTSGKFTRSYFYEGKLHREIGKYTTIWKKIDSQWKIILDIGNEQSL